MAGSLAKYRLSSEYPGIDTCPLYYCSTHGSYMMSYYGESDPLKFIITVPKNTLLIEFSGPDEVCFYTNIKEALEPLLGNREDLLSWLHGIPLLNKYESKVAAKIAACLAACHIYLPGSEICNKIFTMNGGRERNALNRPKGSLRHGPEQLMGFYKYTPGKSEPDEILTKASGRLVEGSYGLLGPRGEGVRQINVESYSSIFDKLPKTDFQILIFPSCGVIVPSAGVNAGPAAAAIRMRQERADAAWRSRTGRSLPELSGYLTGQLKRWGRNLGTEFTQSHANYLARSGSGGGGGGSIGGSRRRFRITRKAKHRRRSYRSKRS